MVDYTTSKGGSGSGVGFIIAAVLVVLVLLYALFAGGGLETATDPAAIDTTAPAAVEQTAPAAEEAAPVTPTPE